MKRMKYLEVNNVQIRKILIIISKRKVRIACEVKHDTSKGKVKGEDSCFQS